MATHSSVLAWRIPGTGEPGGLPSMGSHRVGHDWSDLAASLFLWYCTCQIQFISKHGLLQRLPNYTSYFSFFHLPHDSVPFATSILESVEWRMPKDATCYPSPPSMWVSGSVWSFPDPWPVSLPGKIFPTSSEFLFMRQGPNVTDNPSSSLLFWSNFHLFNIYFWPSWISVAAHRLTLVASSRDDSLIAVLELFTAVASLTAEHGQ